MRNELVPPPTHRPEGPVRRSIVSAASEGPTNVARVAGDPAQADGGSATEAKPRRDRRVEVRLTEDELARFDALAAQLGLARSDVIRGVLPATEAAFDKKMQRAAKCAVADQDELRRTREALAEHDAATNELARQMRAVGYHLSHLLRHARSGGTVPEEAVLAVHDELAAAVTQAKAADAVVYRSVRKLLWAR